MTAFARELAAAVGLPKDVIDRCTRIVVDANRSETIVTVAYHVPAIVESVVPGVAGRQNSLQGAFKRYRVVEVPIDFEG